MSLSGLHLLLTLRCTGECDHCFVWGSPRGCGTMTLEFIRDLLDQAQELTTVTGVFFEGGEPFLFYPAMIVAVREAHRRGFQTGVVTNCYWATSVEDARAALQPLTEVGMDSITLSSDLFHGSGMITPEYLAASQAARELGLKDSVIIVEPPESSVQVTPRGEPVQGGRVMFRGRAAVLLAKDAAKVRAETLTECPHEDLVDPSRVHVDPFGNLHLCQGLAIGNVRRRRLREIMASYQPETDPVIGPLIKGGPFELARCHRVELADGYADACHLCYVTRVVLRSRYPDILTPDQMYGEGLD